MEETVGGDGLLNTDRPSRCLSSGSAAEGSGAGGWAKGECRGTLQRTEVLAHSTDLLSDRPTEITIKVGQKRLRDDLTEHDSYVLYK